MEAEMSASILNAERWQCQAVRCTATLDLLLLRLILMRSLFLIVHSMDMCAEHGGGIRCVFQGCEKFACWAGGM